MNSVVVLSVREGFRQVTMGTWGNPSGMFGGFTMSPDKCHVRRLTKNPAGANSIGALLAWDICDTFPTKISASNTNMYEQSYRGADIKTVKERWMANTGEYHILRGLQMSALNTAGARVSLLDPAQGSMEVFVSGARDRGYIAGNLQGNIYTNSTCAFEIALVNDSTNEAIVLGTLANNKNGTYSIEPSASGFYKTRVRKVFNANRIWLDSTGTVTGIVDGKPGYYLGIRPESSAAARPGDDILLTLGIRSEGEIKAFNFTYKKPDGTNESSPAEVTLGEADYLAVYDKKMLWRANLYIDEGAADWNNVHPWNAPPNGVATATTPKWWNADWGYNDWNVDEAGNVITGATAGKQVVSIKPWSRWNGGEVTNSVAYSWGCWDAVKQFNDELNGQKAQIESYRTSAAAGTAGYVADYATLQWLDTTAAPSGAQGSNSWNNYVFPQLYRDETLNKYYITGTISVPGLSTYWDETVGKVYEYTQTLHSSGIDCSGLAHRSALYSGTQYAIRQHTAIGSKQGTIAFASDSLTTKMHGSGWLIDTKDTDKIAQRDLDRSMISRAVPGDILVKSGSHVVIIQNLNYGEGNTVIKNYSEVKVIHSTTGIVGNLNQYQIMKNQWQLIAQDFENYQLRRLK